MALYNTPYNYLQATVESILSQTFNDFELIVVDDASTIEYQEFFEQFHDYRIKYFKLDKNGGPGHARNLGIKKAQGQYVAIVDSDDIYMPKRFQIQAGFLDKNPDISLISGTFIFSNKKSISETIEKDNEIKTFLLFNSPLANPLIMLRKSTFIEKNLFYPEYINVAEDYKLWINCMFAGIKMANLKELLMIYTRRKNQLSKTNSDKQNVILKTIYKKMLFHLGIDASQKEIELHYNISAEKFINIENVDEIINWFDKIIENNKKYLILDENLLINKKNEVINKFNCSKNKFFKLKLGKFSLSIKKPFGFVKQKCVKHTNIKKNIEYNPDFPKVSVIMPVYNTKEEYLREAIESILNQTFTDFELVIINDDSTNNAEEVILSYKDDRIKYFKLEQNLGPGPARNQGIKMAKGKYIAIADSDDISDKIRFEKQINILENDKNIDVVGTNCTKFPKYDPSCYALEDNQIKNSLIFEHNAVCGASAMMRKEILDKNKIRYDGEFLHAEDYAFWLSLVDIANFKNIEEVLYFYRWHKKNDSKSGMLLQSLNAQYLMFQAQGKHLNIDNTQVLSILDKVKNKQKITSKELKVVETFVNEVNAKIIENNIECNYCLNRIFYKYLLKNCKKDFQFLNILWKSKLNKFANIKIWTKIENTFRIF